MKSYVIFVALAIVCTAANGKPLMQHSVFNLNFINEWEQKIAHNFASIADSLRGVLKDLTLTDVFNLIIHYLQWMEANFMDNIKVILRILFTEIVQGTMSMEELKDTVQTRLWDELTDLLKDFALLKHSLIAWVVTLSIDTAENIVKYVEGVFDSETQNIMNNIAEMSEYVVTVIEFFLGEKSQLLTYLIQLFGLEPIASVLLSLSESIKLQLIAIAALVMFATPSQLNQIQRIFDKLVTDVLANPSNAISLIMDAITQINMIMAG